MEKLFAAALVGPLVRSAAKQASPVAEASGGDLVVEHLEH
jgi:hypothetical protein